jgi:hypothetical protein
MLSLVLLLSGAEGWTQSADVASKTAPSDVVAAWETGTWVAWGDDYPFTGLKDEDRYDDPSIPPENHLPFRPGWEAKWKSIRQRAGEGQNVIDTGNRCAPLGIPYMSLYGIIQFLFARDRVVTTGINDNGIRIIFTDGRPHQRDPDPTYNGDSIGHWEGKTLVIDTTSLRADTYLEPGLPHSDVVHVVERWQFAGPDTINVDVTVEDNKEFTKPLHATAVYTHHPNDRLHEDACENNRDRQVNGATALIGADGKPLIAKPKSGNARFKIIEQ